MVLAFFVKLRYMKHSREYIIKRLKQLKPSLQRRYQISGLALFGSLDGTIKPHYLPFIESSLIRIRANVTYGFG